MVDIVVAASVMCMVVFVRVVVVVVNVGHIYVIGVASVVVVNMVVFLSATQYCVCF